MHEMTLALQNWSRTISFLMVQYFGKNGRAGPFSLFMTLVEPVLGIVSLYVLRGVFRDMQPNWGTSLLLFLVTGFLPYYMFLRTSTLARAATNPRQAIPRLHSMDVIFSQVAANTLVMLITMSLLHIGMWLYGIQQARPESIGRCAYALLLLVALGAGIGLLNSAISRYFPFWLTIYGIATRGLLFFSGVILVADFYPFTIRSWVVWNPLMHAITEFRLGVYGTYPSFTLDLHYLEKSAFFFVFLGFVADRASLRYGGR